MKDLELARSIKEQEEEKEDYINHLPSELILVIFNKLSEAKCLCRCSIVSKRFSSLILQTHKITTEILNLKWCPQRRWNRPLPPPERIFSRLARSFHFLRQPLISPRHSFLVFLSYGDKIVKFFKNFISIESMYFILDHPGCSESNIVKWKAEFRSFEVSSFVILFARSSNSERENEEEELEECEPTMLSDQERIFYVELAAYYLINVQKGHYILWSIVRNNFMVRNSVILDSQNYGRMFIRDEQVVEMKNFDPKMVAVPIYKRTKSGLKLWYVPFLQLSNGVVMQGVKLALSKNLEDAEADEEIVRDAFEGEDQYYGEALMQMILKKTPIISAVNE